MIKSWTTEDDAQMDIDIEKLVIQKQKNRIVGVSTVHDYVFRPQIYEDVNVYEWIQCAKRIRISTKIGKLPQLLSA